MRASASRFVSRQWCRVKIRPVSSKNVSRVLEIVIELLATDEFTVASRKLLSIAQILSDNKNAIKFRFVNSFCTRIQFVEAESVLLRLMVD